MSMRCLSCGSQVHKTHAFCPQCGTAITQQGSRENLKGDSPTLSHPLKRWFPAILTALVLIAGLGTFLSQLLRTYHPTIEQQPTVAVPSMYSQGRIASVPVEARMDNNAMVISLKDVLAYKIVRFEDPERKAAAPMIAYLSPNGKLVTAMSISENCRSTDFYLQGDNIHCASCPSYWNMSSLEAYACCQKYYPDPIPSTVMGDEVRIDASVARNWHTRM
jgi:uncharacterized protein